MSNCLKVIHFISAPAAGGAETFIKSLSLCLSQLAVVPVIIFLSRAEEIGRGKDYENKFLNELDEGGVQYYFLAAKSRKNPLKAVLSFIQIIKKENPDLIHSHMLQGNFCALFCRCKLIYTHHSVLLNARHVWFKIFDKRVNCYVGIANACVDALEPVVKKPIKKIPNAISKPLDTITFQDYASSNNHAIRILAVGRIVHEKNYGMLVFVAKEIKKMNLDFMIKVVGGGSVSAVSKLQKRINSSGLSDRFILVGEVSDVYSYYKDADIFVMTSRFEGMPISLIEATSLGLPSVVTKAGGCEEVVSITKSGVVVNVDDVSGFVNSLSRLILSSELRRSLSCQAVNNSTYFHMERCAKEHVDLYSSLI